MKQILFPLTILLCVGILSSISLMTKEYEWVPGEIIVEFHSHITEDMISEFIVDHSEFGLDEMYHMSNYQPDHYSIKSIYHFIFNNGSIIDHDFLAMIRTDERVFAARFHTHWTRREIEVRLTHLSYFEEFRTDYGFRFLDWWGKHNLVFGHHFENGEEFDILETVRNDERVEFAWLPMQVYPGDIIALLQKNIQEELLDELISDYSQYSLRLQSQPLESSIDVFVELAFNFSLLHEFDFVEIFRQDERVKMASPNGIGIRPHVPPDPPAEINDETLPLSQISSFVYPNPVRVGEAIIRVNMPNSISINSLKSIDSTIGSEIRIYNIKGQLINKSRDFQTINGIPHFIWDKKDMNNQDVASGVYFYRIQMNNEGTSGRFLIIK